MQHTVKGRQKILQAINQKRIQIRKPEHYDDAILLGSKGGLTRKKIKQIVGRMKKKREVYLEQNIPQILSSDKVLLTGAKVTATDMATRISLKYLTKPLRLMGLSKEQLNSFERVLSYRGQTIKGTSIEVRPPLELLVLNIVVAFGENGYLKAREAAEKVAQRGITLRKMATKSKHEETDVFYNVAPRAMTVNTFLNFKKETFLSQILPSIRERELELERLKKETIPNKETYIRTIENQIKEARKNYILFRQNNM